jgi:hypothetical protein
MTHHVRRKTPAASFKSPSKLPRQPTFRLSHACLSSALPMNANDFRRVIRGFTSASASKGVSLLSTKGSGSSSRTSSPKEVSCRSMANALSPMMTLRDFENGYWYLDQLKNFAERIGTPSCEEAAKRRTRKGHRGETKIGGFLVCARR